MVLFSLFIDSVKIYWFGFLQMPSFIFHILGILGMIAMGISAFILDSKDPKSNWIEQINNSLSQFFIFLGVILYFFLK